MIDGNWVCNHVAIMGEIEKFYKNLCREDQDQFPRMDYMDFGSLASIDVDWLERPFLEDEILSALKSTKGDKASSTDGFPISFFQRG